MRSEHDILSKISAVDGWLSTDEALALHAISSGCTRILEIGAWKGKSTICLALPHTYQGTKRVFSIDPFDASGEAGSAEEYAKLKGQKPLLDQFQDNLAKAGCAHVVQPIVGTSETAFFDQRLPKEVDFVFIDGDHSIRGAMLDFLLSLKLLRSGGTLAFHDYDPSRPSLGPTYVVDRVHELAAGSKYKLSRSTFTDTLAVFNVHV